MLYDIFPYTLRKYVLTSLVSWALLLLATSALAAAYSWDGTGMPPAIADTSNNTLNVTLGAGTNVTASITGNNGGSEGINNTITITGTGTAPSSGNAWTGSVHGAASSGTLQNNTISINGVDIDGGVLGGHSTGSSVAEGNAIIFINSSVSGTVMGGDTRGLAKNNSITLTNSEATGHMCGGYGSGAGGISEGNSITVTGSSVRDVTGGHSQGLSTGNKLTIEGASVVSAVAEGGVSFNGAAEFNAVLITGGEVQGTVVGGKGATKALNNSVTITSGIMRANVFGGYSDTGSLVSQNRVELSGNAVLDIQAIGGRNSVGDSTYNTVNVSGNVTARNSVTGGEANAGSATHNTVKMEGGTVFVVVGGRGGIDTAYNWVEMSGGTVTENMFGGVGIANSLVKENVVVLSGGRVDGEVQGGSVIRGGKVVQGNEVHLSGTASVGTKVTGGFSSRDQAIENVVIMTGGSLGDALSGGVSSAKDAVKNTVTMSAGTVGGDVRGGVGVTGAADNVVSFSGGDVAGVVYGGQNTGAGSALRNTVVLADAMVVQKSVYGGHSTGGAAQGNGVSIGGTASVGEAVIGGFSQTDLSTLNVVEMTGGNVAASLTGGESATLGATTNAVKLSGGTVGGALTGGSAGTEATGNTVLMEGGTVGDDVRGGAGVTEATDNSVDLSGGTVQGHVYGGQNTGAGSALRNTVVLADAMVVQKSVYGGHSTGGAAEDNAVGVSGTVEVRGAVVGGFSQGDVAKGNTVEVVSGSVLGYVAGGETEIGTAADNTVNLHGGTLASAVYGGYATDTGSATGNVVNIHGGVLGPAVYGGYAAGVGSATGNTLNIYGNPDMRAAVLHGGWAGGDARSGNELNVFSMDLEAVNVGHFAKYNFILPRPVMPGDTVLNLTDTAPTIVGDATVGVGKIGSGMLLRPGDRIYLLRNETGGVQAEGMTSHTIKGQHGVSVEYDFRVRATDTTVEIYLDPATDPVRVRPETKALAEAYVATLALINQGAELATKSAVAAAGARKEDPWGLYVFGTVAGGSARYNTGSHVDLSGTNMVAGVSKALPVQDVRVLLGAFVEAGFARYQTNNGFSDRPSVTARGNNRYMGGGLLAHATRMVKDSSGKMRQRGPYVEATVRAGQMDMDFASKDLRDMTGSQASYKASAPYVGAHVGTGYVWDLSDSTTAEVYGQVYWTHLKGDKFRVLGDPITVDDVNSWRLRAGGRLSHAWNDRISGYVGAAYEHSLDGKIKARAYTLRIPSPALQGGSGLVEAGLRLTPSGDGGFSSDINVQGAFGHKQSIGGEITMQYEF